jgi:hypothetical protein
MVMGIAATIAALACANTPTTGTMTPDPCSGLCTCPMISTIECCQLGCDLVTTPSGTKCGFATHPPGELSGSTCVYPGSDAGAVD